MDSTLKIRANRIRRIPTIAEEREVPASAKIRDSAVESTLRKGSILKYEYFEPISLPILQALFIRRQSRMHAMLRRRKRDLQCQSSWLLR